MCDSLRDRVLSELRARRRRFTPALPRSIGLDVAGLYAFWVGEECLYVGMSVNVGDRLYQHRVQPHNGRLERYLRAFPREVEASIAPVPGNARNCLRRLEQEAIRDLRPRTNIAA